LAYSIFTEERKLTKLIPELIYGYDDDTIEAVVGELLRGKRQTVSTAESCTGGLIAHKLTSVSGSSDYFQGSIISYANQVKIASLGVSELDIQTHGAVSEAVVTRMAEAVKAKMQTDFAIATSGIAGPTGGTDEKPVGTVWIAVAGPNGTTAKKYLFGQNRERNIEISANTALNMLRKQLI
jgi:nicotinamide-nucleotide amidase